MRYLLICFFLVTTGSATAQTVAQTPEKRCTYRPSREFLLSKNDSCFDITRREADRAFTARCWDEAMSLYRAAKSCSDANQRARSVMNTRIVACRDSAEQELRRSEQAARRQFLHATASNLADIAHELLNNYDRSTGYRLADFAEQYVAPNQNPKCIQALLDAWYYVPPKQGSQSSDLRVPFCYQVNDDMGSGVQARFTKSGRLYAFAPSKNTLFAWDTESLKPQKPIQIEKGLPNFDISPDDRTLLFFSNNTILFWRNPKDTFRLKVRDLTRYCFSPNGDEFLFFDVQQAKIFSLEFRSGSTYRNMNVQRKAEKQPEPRAAFSINFEVLGMAYRNGLLWLGGRDSIVVYEAGRGKEQQWKRVKTIAWPAAMPYNAGQMLLSPGRGTAFVFSDDSLHYYRLPMLTDSQLVATKMASILGSPIAIKPDASWFAYSWQEALLYVSSDSIAAHFGSYLRPDETFHPLHGAISPDNRWLAAATDTGSLKIWALHDRQRFADVSLNDVERVVFSQNGDHFAFNKGSVLQMFDTDQPEKSLWSEQVFSENILVDAVSNRHVAWRPSADVLRVKNVTTGQKWDFPVQSDTNRYLPVTIDEKGRFVAYAALSDSVVVRSTMNGEVLAHQNFNGEILQLRSIPKTGELVVIQSLSSGFYTESQTVAKIWNPALTQTKPRSVRLHGFRISWSEAAPGDNLVAFSSGSDIRVFDLDNLLDERVRIRPSQDHFFSALAFYPDGTALATGYEDGTVVVWDLTSGEERFHLKLASDWIDELSFPADGGRLRLKTLDGSLLNRDIAPELIRAAAQTENRRLAPFTPEQIRAYELERALDYSGNFQRLAESGDLPLIRSFFEYYRRQALGSNNISKVKAYFESASDLYSRLDDPATQQALRPTMFEIYEDYNWKLLLREKNADAQRVLSEFNRLFDKPLTALKMSAHTALLRNDIPTAARQYADWTMRIFEQSDYEPFEALDSLEKQFLQVAEYNLLDRTQLDCVCGLYSNILKINNLCPFGSNVSALPLDTETRLRWNIFQHVRSSSTVVNRAKKARLLESAFADAQTLSRQNPARWRNQLEKTTLALVRAYTSWGEFEQGNEYAQAVYRQALRLLDTFDIFKFNEPERLKELATNHVRLGNCFLTTDRVGNAVQHYEAGLAAIEQLFRITPADSLPAFRNDRQAILLTQLGAARLLEGNPAAAKVAFERASDAMFYGLNTLYLGHVALLENNENGAIKQYKGIYAESQLGQVLFEIGRLAARFPERRAKFEAFMPRLRDSILAGHPEMSPDMVDYYLAEQEAAYAFANGRWKDAVGWNEKSLEALEKIAALPDASGEWKQRMLSALLTHSYYLLYTGMVNANAFTQSILSAERAEAFAQKEYPSYQYLDWIKTNRAHASLLRNQPGDRENAIAIYREFLKMSSYEYDYWELLQKDFRDLHRAGLRWPDLKKVIEAVKPADVEITPKEWEEMGTVN